MTKIRVMVISLCMICCIGWTLTVTATPPGPGVRQAVRQPMHLRETHIRISIGNTLGAMKPLLGINAGPAPSGESGNVDLTAQYRWAGVQEVRTQDFYGPLDLSVMYPNLAADPDAKGSYDFVSSDNAFASIVNAGIEPYLRLGDSYSNVRVPATGQELENYGRAGVKVVQHYRQGAISGFKTRFRYVEIGNEPDNRHFWPARYEDFFPFFVNVFKKLKQSMPDLKVGGPGFVVSSYKIPAQRHNVARFLGYLKQHGVQPDFISFHLYSDDPAEYYDMVQFYRREAKRHGMEKVELHVSEWNTETAGLEVRVGRKAAPYVTACWIALQEAGTDASYLFRGTDTNIDNPGFYGIFYADGRKKPAANAFHLWSRMARFSERLETRTGVGLLDAAPSVNGPLKPVWILAGKDKDGNIGMLLANIGQQQIAYNLTLPKPAKRIEVIEFDNPQGELITRQPGNDGTPLILLKPMSVQFLCVQVQR
jgi:xylan 1,4-beta-xylosidase